MPLACNCNCGSSALSLFQTLAFMKNEIIHILLFLIVLAPYSSYGQVDKSNHLNKNELIKRNNLRISRDSTEILHIEELSTGQFLMIQRKRTRLEVEAFEQSIERSRKEGWDYNTPVSTRRELHYETIQSTMNTVKSSDHLLMISKLEKGEYRLFINLHPNKDAFLSKNNKGKYIHLTIE